MEPSGANIFYAIHQLLVHLVLQTEPVNIYMRRVGHYPPLSFVRYINSVPGEGADYAHRIGLSPLDLKMFRRACAVIM